MHLRAAELLVVALLPRGHLHQRRTAQADLPPLFDHHDVIANAREEGTACGRVAEHQRDRGDRLRRLASQVAETPATRDEDLTLRRQLRAAGLDQVDDGQPVLFGDLCTSTALLCSERVGRTAAHCRVIRADEAFGALDDTDPGDNGRADLVAGPPRCERRQLEKRRVRVEQQLDPFAGEQLAALTMPFDVLLTATTARDRQLTLDLGKQLQQGGASLGELWRIPVDAVGQHGHARSLCGLQRWPCNHVGVLRVYLESGKKWTFACALDWPGWCRRAKG